MAAFHGEHAAADAPVPARMVEFMHVATNEMGLQVSNGGGHVQGLRGTECGRGTSMLGFEDLLVLS